MSGPGKRWFHIVFNTHGSWLHGDERGFHSRGHRLHSSGDYRHPPPSGEHAGLHRYMSARCPMTVTIEPWLRACAGRAVVRDLERRGARPLVVSVGATHVHALAELPRDTPKAEVGTVKRVASLALRGSMPGRVWSEGCTIKPIRDDGHQREVYGYIRRHASEGAWAWTFREAVVNDPANS